MGKARKRHVQQELVFARRGGGRRGAGRPAKGWRSSERHGRREVLRDTEPVHVTVRVVPMVASLRTRAMYRAIRWATLAVARRDTFRIIHMSIQRDHLHLIVEADDRIALARGMQAFQSSAAQHINRALGRRGQVFADRYHPHILRTPREVRHAIAYVLGNWRKHREDRGRTWKLDPFASGIAFPHWRELADSPVLYKPPPTYDPLLVWHPKTWLLDKGWRTHAPISVSAIPRSRPA